MLELNGRSQSAFAQRCVVRRSGSMTAGRGERAARLPHACCLINCRLTAAQIDMIRQAAGLAWSLVSSPLPLIEAGLFGPEVPLAGVNFFFFFSAAI